MTTVNVGNRSLSLTQVISWLTIHLNATVAVEFFTIPIYLTAIYSFTNRALNYVDPEAGPDDPKQPLFDMQQRLLSVAVQEMYHMQLAANLCNALGETPVVPQLTLEPDREIPVPHLKNVTIPRLGNVPAMIDGMIAIERPDPDHVYPQPNENAEYSSIADLYHATAELLGIVAKASLDSPAANDVPPFTGGHQVSYGTFTYTYNWNTIPQDPTSPLSSAVEAINAITDQGEGKNVISAPRVQALLGKLLKLKAGEDGQVNKAYQPAEGTRFYAYGAWSHEVRFEDVKQTLQSAEFKKWDDAIRFEYKQKGYDVGVFYEGNKVPIDIDPPAGWNPKMEDIYAAIDALWSTLTDMLASGFQGGSLSPENFPPDAQFGFNDVMLSFKYALPLMWRAGYAPSYHYKSGSYDLQTAFDVVDPYCVIHWDDITAALRKDPTFVQNVCQGLNTCQSRGWGGTGKQQGGGDCACCTADLHTCGGGNSCTARGACGYLSTGASSSLLPPADQWIPSLNQGKGTGGCQTPISPVQVFSSAQKPQIESQTGPEWTAQAKLALEALAGKSVWEHARTLHNWSTTPPPKPVPPPDAKVDYDGLIRRQLVQATVIE